jgi:hypothetical protein
MHNPKPDRQADYIRNKKAIYVVTPDDVVLLGGQAGVAMNRSTANEWLENHLIGIESAIDSYIQAELQK